VKTPKIHYNPALPLLVHATHLTTFFRKTMLLEVFLNVVPEINNKRHLDLRIHRWFFQTLFLCNAGRCQPQL